jgi:hypothetical protein
MAEPSSHTSIHKRHHPATINQSLTNLQILSLSRIEYVLVLGGP